MPSENSNSPPPRHRSRSRSRTSRARRLVLLGLTLALLSVAPLPAAVDIQLGLNFTGSTSGVDVFANPADANGAIGPAHYVEFINGRFAVYNKATGARLLGKSDEKLSGPTRESPCPGALA